MKKDRKKSWGLKTIFSVIMQNWSALLSFELIYKIVGLTMFFPFLRNLISFLPGLIRESYLSQENIVQILLIPAALLLSVCILLLLGGYLYLEIVALTIYSEKGWNKEKITLLQLVCKSLTKILGLFKLKRIAVFILLLAMPLSFFCASSVFVRAVQIPEFILTAISENVLYTSLLLAAFLLVNYMFFLYLFGFPILLFTDVSFKGSWRESLRLLKGRKLQTMGRILYYTFVFLLLLFIIWLAGVLAIAGAVRIFNGVDGRWLFGLYYDTFTGAWNLLAGAFISVFLCALAIVLYHWYRGDVRIDVVKKKWTIKHVMSRVAVVLVISIFFTFLGDTELGRQIIYPDKQEVLVVAHRAGGVFGPENTVAGLNQAIEMGADMAEIDVQQLKDGTLVVLHDTNFKRTTGVDLNVWDADYEQVKSLDAGSYHSSEYAGEPVPTLEEMLKAAKGKIELMIELKATGREQSLVEDTLALIGKYDMENQCNIASLDIHLLKQAKALNPDIDANYITVLLVSKTYDLSQIDGYSVETTFLSRELVYQAHAQGKRVYGWTASSDENIKKVLSYETNGIVTDNPLMVEYILDTLEENDLKKAIADIFF